MIDEKLILIEKERIKEAATKVSTSKDREHSGFDILDLIDFMKVMRKPKTKKKKSEEKIDNANLNLNDVVSINLNKNIDNATIELKYLMKSDESNKIYYAYLMKLLEELKNKNIVISSFRSYVWKGGNQNRNYS